MARWIYNPEAIEPPEPVWAGECPKCGTPLNYDDEVIINDTSNEVIGCQFCTSRRNAGDVFEED